MSRSDVFRVFSEKKPEFAVEAEQVLRDIRSDLSISTLEKVRVINRYDVSGISDDEYRKARTIVFSEPPLDDVYDEEIDLFNACYVLAVESLPGQYDQRADSAAQCIQIITQKDQPKVRTAKLYAFYGTLMDDEKTRINTFLINPVEARAASLDKPDSLEDQLTPPEDIRIVSGFIEMSESGLKDLLSEMGLAMSLDDLVFTREFFSGIGRDPSVTEIRVLDTYWSDHCRHTTFLTKLTDVRIDGESEISGEISTAFDEYNASREKVYGDNAINKPVCLMDMATIAMKRLRAEGKLADLDESEEINACSIRVRVNVDGKSEDYLLMFKNETHNHPTEIEPFGGAATCLGGAIRDPLSGRSYVYQAMRVTGAGDPTVPVSETLPGKLSQKKLVRTAAAGYSTYGNQIGLATGLVEEIYHPGYIAKRMEIGAVIAAAPTSHVVRERPQDGDIVILIGGRTGRDGIGGATGSSKAHDETSVVRCGAEVQKGNPPTERKIQRLFRKPEVSRMIIRCNDFGAGGVSVAIGELADGIDIDLDAVPKKYEGLDGTELAISESQERMAVVIKREDEERFFEEAAKENLEAVRVATVTEKPNMVMRWRKNVIVDLPRSFINTNGAPAYSSVTIVPPDMDRPYIDSVSPTAQPEDFAASLRSGLSSVQACSQKGLVQRFDSTIGAGTVLMPYGGKFQNSPEEGMVCKIPVAGGDTDTVSVMTYGFDPYLSEWSPYHGAYHAVVDSLLKQAVLGADPMSARLTFQEYFERLTTRESWGKPAAALLGAFRAQLDYSTPAIGGKDSMSGTFKDIHVPPTLVSFAVATTTADKIVSSVLSAPGEKLYLIRLARSSTAVYRKDHVLRVFKAFAQMRERGQIMNAAVVRGAGVACRIAQMCFGNQVGFRFDESWDIESLFSRTLGAVIVSVRDGNAVEKIEAVGGRILGKTDNSGSISLKDSAIDLQDALAAYKGKMEPIFPTRIVEKNRCPVIPADPNTEYSVPGILKHVKPTVFIPVFPGTNTEYDAARAFEIAGATPDILVIRNRNAADIGESLAAMREKINSAQIIMLPGGFSGGDEPEGSAKFIVAALFNPNVSEAVRELLFKRDGLMLGICNGFQALLKVGLLPYGDIVESTPESPTLTFNRIGRHQSVYVSTRVVSTRSPWMSLCREGDVFSIPVSHGEGRFVASDETLKNLFRTGSVGTVYVDEFRAPSMETVYNPNGSACSIEGIFGLNGRIYGKMGHNERYGKYVGKNIPGNKDQRLFESGVRYFIG
ncbi:MAG: phosphoribosylformylglycinamidine synthase [Clostridiales bacterium]|nr:phosphoribosylformylglycinamidine synthase [Clostridiales bacterium]